MTSVYSPTALDSHLQKIQKIAVTVFGIILSCATIIYLVFEIYNDIIGPSNSINVTTVFERSRIIERLLNLTDKDG
jgi:hypothetical protein